jgi:hypothetical protein
MLGLGFYPQGKIKLAMRFPAARQVYGYYLADLLNYGR